MKQKIYDIPIWESFQNEICECPLCAIEQNLQNNLISTLFSEMVMDVRLNPQLVEDYDFCTDHFEKLYKYPDKCGLAVLTSRILYSKRQKLKFNMSQPVETRKYSISTLFNNRKHRAGILTKRQCLICEKLSSDMLNYIESLVILWLKDENFKHIYSNSKGFCLKHFYELIEQGKLCIKSIDVQKDFINTTLNLQQDSLDRLQDELDWFVSKFDYRFANEPWKTSKDSLVRTIQKLIGTFNSR